MLYRQYKHFRSSTTLTPVIDHHQRLLNLSVIYTTCPTLLRRCAKKAAIIMHEYAQRDVEDDHLRNKSNVRRLSDIAAI